MEIYQELTSVFSIVFDDPEIVLRPEMVAQDVYGWDSLSNMTLMLAIETHFKIKIPLGVQRDFKNVGDIANHIINTRGR